MSVLQNSRYSNGVSVTGSADGATKVGVVRGPQSFYTKFLHYTTTGSDRLDRLAYRFYQDASLWWVIADVNPELVFPEPLPPGVILRIPQA